MEMEFYKTMYNELAKYCEIPFEEYEKMVKISSIYNIKKGEYFLRAGDKPTSFGFVVSGILRLFYANHSGDEFNKSFCVENNFVTSYSALIGVEVINSGFGRYYIIHYKL